jgi:hypothetical protein
MRGGYRVSVRYGWIGGRREKVRGQYRFSCPHTHAGAALRKLTMHISTNDLHCCKPARLLPPRSSSPAVAGYRLGGYPVRRDRWGGERVVGGVS